MKRLKLLKDLNLVVSTIIAVLALYIVLHPILPEIIFAMSTNKFEGYVYNTNESALMIGDKSTELPLIPIDNRIVIPRIYVNASINEGEDIDTLDHGMWRRPNTSLPSLGGNTVITAHRFLHKNGPNTFYHLDKIQQNDDILIYWKGKEYVYKVYEIKEIDPSEIEIEYNTKDSIITLYTCTPLWTSEKRLVVRAKLQ